MPDKPRKAAERRIAASFGARRQIGSGSLGRDDRSSSDSTHEVLYIEAKYRKRHTAVALYDDTAKKAKKEGKIPVVAMMALANCTRIRLENGVELTVSETAREIDRMTKGGK